MEKTHERIRQLRENHKETQQTVAAYLNISQWQYAACESGTYEWRPEHIKKNMSSLPCFGGLYIGCDHAKTDHYQKGRLQKSKKRHITMSILKDLYCGV